MKVFTVEQMRLAEQLATETAGISTLDLMYNAGRASADIIKSNSELSGKHCVAICGNGGNGGDGFCTLIRLKEAGANVTAVLLMGEPKSADAAELYTKLVLDGIRVVKWANDIPLAASVIANADIIIDAIFGIGFYGIPNGTVSDAIDCINNSSACIYSLDIPSGLEADFSLCINTHVNANVTIVFSQPKHVHLQYPSIKACGEIIICDIGIPERIINNISSKTHLVDTEYIRSILPKRAPDVHKGECGKVLAICGAYNMPGAAIMCCLGAIKSGAGLVKLAIPESIYPIVAGKIPEITYLPIPCKGKNVITCELIRAVSDELDHYDCIVFGCGLGITDTNLKLLDSILHTATCPIVIDADGISLLSKSIDILNNRTCDIILTPHMGEMARLIKSDIETIKANRISTARQTATNLNITLVLKGAKTVVASCDGSVMCNPTGNAGMAKAGSGDILAGILASLVAQGMNTADAATAAVYIHGLAGDICENELTQFAITSSDIISALSGAFKTLTTA